MGKKRDRKWSGGDGGICCLYTSVSMYVSLCVCVCESVTSKYISADLVVGYQQQGQRQ